MSRHRPSAAPALRGADWALFLDIDGTLLDLAPTPDLVRVPATLPAVLGGLEACLGGALALISGRDLAAIDRLFPGQHDAAGAHGAQWRLNGRIAGVAAFAEEGLVQTTLRQAAALPGIMVERKAAALAFHYRHATDHGHAARALAERLRAAAAVPLRVQEGKMVVEVVPAGADKGTAIERFLDLPPYLGRRPLFIGDDITDESGFAVVNRLDGLSIHVGRDETTAGRRLSSPRAVRRWLAWTLGNCKGNDHEHA